MEWDFAANAEIDADTHAKVPEGFRGAYAEKDGKYVISDTHKPFVEAITGLSTALRGERNVTKGLKGQKDVAAVIKETLGFDTIEDAKAKIDELTTQVATAAKVDPAKIRAEIEKTFNTEREGLNGKVASMQKTLEKYLVEKSAISALAAAKGSAELLLPHVQGKVKVVEDGEEYVVRVLDASGDYRGDGRGGFMTVEDLVAEMKQSKTFAAAFESDNQGGSDTRTTKPGEGQRQQQRSSNDRDNMSPNELLAAGLAARRNQRR